ncbi:LuxR C-terminal-related transcriptional regulator [Antrihabitans spumae]|uniref:LuxR C-terminal-related transcriptional regulator n=1 Tax=Antrihabitans spumae TaxID=3373370 RepID=A0ABW7KAP0_9NOCA
MSLRDNHYRRPELFGLLDERATPVPTVNAVATDLVRPVLSIREREVLMAWLAADSKLEAGRSLYIATGTMNTHIARIRTKYAAVGRPAPTKAALFARALQDGLTRLSDW